MCLQPEGVVRIETQSLIDDLLQADEGRWQEAHGGKPITPYYLRECLKMVIPHTDEMEKARQWKEAGTNTNKRGYAEDHFEDAWRRYLGRSKPSAYKKNMHAEEEVSASATSGTSGTGAENPENTNTYVGPDAVPDEKQCRTSGTASGAEENEQNQIDSASVPDGPDVPDGQTVHREGSFPRGGMRRRRPNGNGNGVGDRS